MPYPTQRFLLWIAVAAAAPALGQEPAATRLEEVTVEAALEEGPLVERVPAALPLARPAARDAASLLDTVPGAAVLRNGPQTGIVQLRGLAGDRVRVQVNGLEITPACPNHMDPPLSYVTPAQVERLRVLPGAGSIRYAGDSIAGAVVVESAPPRFAAPGAFGGYGQVAAGYSGADDERRGLAEVGLASERFSLRAAAEAANAHDLAFPGGRVLASGYDIARGDVTLAGRVGDGTLALDLGQHRTRDAGTPALPMDIVSADADRYALRYLGGAGALKLEARAYASRIDHLMDNFSLRPAGMMRMQAPATSDDDGFGVDAQYVAGGHVLRGGAEVRGNDYAAYQQNVVTRARQDLFRDATRRRVGVYGEWEAQPAPRWLTVLGVRTDWLRSDAGNIVESYPMNAADRAAFNARDHRVTDQHWDALARVRYALLPIADIEATLARMTRSPSLLERYLWTPSSASAGLADGRTYLGNLDLDPEVAHQASVGVALRGSGWRATPSVFYSRVTDYIQGTPIARLDPAGRQVLQFRNVGRAELYGFDGDLRRHLAGPWTLRATASYVRGENRDDGDNLYRIAPLNGQLALDYERERWSASAEWRLAARQGKVSAFNGETPTGGYGVVNLRLAWRPVAGAEIHAGVENVFDKYYADHLGGVNRVTGSDVPVGVRLPGAGRFGYVQLAYRW